ncbi:beta-xylosidase [Sphingomonas prati]|nr:beta-xylosidase [Sphingomonas prati]
MVRALSFAGALALFAAFAGGAVRAAPAIPVTVAVDVGRPGKPVNPVWRFFGADEPNYATMKDGRTTLATLGKLAPDRVYFRTHNLLTSGDGTAALKWGSTNAYTEDAESRPRYDWTIVDRIFDTYRARGVRPYVEVGFMPEALSSKPVPYQHDWRPGSGDLRTGWAYPPKDYAKWDALVFAWVTHCVERYGRQEVASWYFETWNEPNLPQYYWGGTQAEFFKLHDTTVRAVRRALPEARVGGPDIAGAGDQYLTQFMAHAAKAGTPTDFLSFHAKGNPTVVGTGAGSHVRMGLSAQLKAADHEYAQIAANPAFRTKPIIIGEADPEGCAACQGPANAYRNGTMYSSYTVASFVRLQALAERRGLNLEGILTWAFEFEDQAPFAGFRQLTSGGIDLPVINVFKLFAKLRGRELPAVSDHQPPLDAVMADGVRGAADIGSIAAIDGDRVAVLVWHYHDDDVAGPDAAVRVALAGLPRALRAGARVTQYRVDPGHSNSYAAWLGMGSPLAPTSVQRAALLKAAALAESVVPMVVKGAGGVVDVVVPRSGVTLVVVEPRG